MVAPWKKSYDQPRQHIKKQRHHFTDKGSSIQSYSFSNIHIWIWELDHKEGWVLKSLCFWTTLEKTLESPLDSKEIQPVLPKEISPEYSLERVFIGYWNWNSNTLATWCEELTHLKRPWCWERLKVGGEGDDREDGWMASLTQWTWVWISSESC